MTRNASGNDFTTSTELQRFLADIVVEFDGEEGEEGGEGDDGSSGSDGDGTGEGEEGTGSSGDGSDGSIKDPDKKRLSDEAAKYRNERNEMKSALDEALGRLRKIEDQDKSDLEKAQRDATEATARAEKAEAKLREVAVENAFFKSGVAGQFHDPTDALDRLRDMQPDDEGEVDVAEIKSRVEKLLKEKPYLKADSGSGDGDGGTGGEPRNPRRKKEDEASLEKLKGKYPALAQRV